MCVISRAIRMNCTLPLGRMLLRSTTFNTIFQRHRSLPPEGVKGVPIFILGYAAPVASKSANVLSSLRKRCKYSYIASREVPRSRAPPELSLSIVRPLQSPTHDEVRMIPFKKKEEHIHWALVRDLYPRSKHSVNASACYSEGC